MAVHVVAALKSFLANTFALTAFLVFVDQSLHKFFEPYCPQYCYTFKCVVPENMHSSPIEGIFFESRFLLRIPIVFRKFC